jgi:uncharacterized protein YydD (DUF2326 family)
MIHEIASTTRPSFKKLAFRSGLNIVLVRRTEDSGQGAKRNAAGKSSLIDIFHFLLGGNREASSPLGASELATDCFRFSIDILGDPAHISRSLDQPARVEIEGEFKNWPVRPDIDEKTGRVTMAIGAWCDLLGRVMFGLPPESQIETGEFLSFRSCIAYFARRQRVDGYSNWRRFFGQQKPVQWQVTLSYLFGLDREGPVQLHRVKEAERQKANLERLLRSELTATAIPSTSKLQTEARRLKGQIDRLERQLDGFKVIAAYEDLVDEANRVQQEIDDLNNANVLDDELIKDIEISMRSETPPALPDLDRLYKEAGVSLPGLSLRRYEEVKEFHAVVVTNRREHLQVELTDARARLARRQTEVAEFSERRNELLTTLNSGGALQQYRKLDGQMTQLRSRYEAVSRQRELSEKISLLRSDLRVKRAEAERRIKQDLMERRTAVDEASAVFDQISTQLYDRSAQLDIRAGKEGIDFNIDNPEKASDGINKMQIFTFDLTLATICANRGSWPGFLIHDSHIFDGVDGRQVASALKVAGERTKLLGGQYIITMNSDDLEKAEKEGEVSFAEAIVHPELDDSPTGCLFGFRFATNEDPTPTEDQP